MLQLLVLTKSATGRKTNYMYTHIYLDLKKTVICEMNYLAQTVRLIWHVLTQREVVLFVGKDIGKDTCMYAKHSRMHGLLFFAT